MNESWQPIATAPRDRSRIELWLPTLFGGQPDFGRFESDEFARKPRPYFTGERTWIGALMYRANQPTHWRPVSKGPDLAPPTVSPHP